MKPAKMDSDTIANNPFLDVFYMLQATIRQCCRTVGGILRKQGIELTITRSEFFSADFS